MVEARDCSLSLTHHLTSTPPFPRVATLENDTTERQGQQILRSDWMWRSNMLLEEESMASIKSRV